MSGTVAGRPRLAHHSRARDAGVQIHSQLIWVEERVLRAAARISWRSVMQRDLANSAVRSARSSSSAAASDWRRAAWTASSANSDDTGYSSRRPCQSDHPSSGAAAAQAGVAASMTRRVNGRL
jgi:hypothetical protein